MTINLRCGILIEQSIQQGGAALTTIAHLSAYLTTAMLSWLPPHDGDVKWYETISNDVAEVALSEDEPSLFENDYDKSVTALTLASIARWESNYIKRIDAGKCYTNECDHGNAFSMWQIHPVGGIVLIGTSYTYYSREAPADVKVIKGIDLINDRKLACKTAMHFARVSLKKYKSLCMYTGESCKSGRHPNADARLYTALNYAKAHPFVQPETDVSLR